MAANKRLELDRFGEPFVLREAPIPDPPKNGAVVKLYFTGICHTDVHMSEGVIDLGGGKTWDLGDAPEAKVLGHEMSGEIHSLGSDVNIDEVNLHVGDHVMVYPTPGCADCGFCKSGENLICPQQDYTQIGFLLVDGGYQSYVSIERVTWLHRVPSGLSMEMAAIIPCSGITAYNALCSVKGHIDKFIKCSGSATLLIVGAGGLGLWGIEIAKAIMPEGTTIAVAEILETKFPAAREAGADTTVLWNAKASPDENAETTKQTLGGVHAAVDFVGAGSTSTALFGCLVSGGKLTVVGLAGGTLSVPTAVLANTTITIAGSLVGTQRHLDELAELVAERKVKGPPIYHVTLTDVGRVIGELKQGKRSGKTVVSHLQ